jgi:hypothetical protein
VRDRRLERPRDFILVAPQSFDGARRFFLPLEVRAIVCAAIIPDKAIIRQIGRSPVESAKLIVDLATELHQVVALSVHRNEAVCLHRGVKIIVASRELEIVFLPIQGCCRFFGCHGSIPFLFAASIIIVSLYEGALRHINSLC